MHVSEIDTPALVVDLDVMERNLRRVADYTRQHDLRLRPHTKTHKSTRIGSRQLQLGAAGLTVAKISEAEVMMGAEPPDLLVAYPIIGRTKLERLTALARKTRITVALDSLFAARQLSDAAAAAQVEVGVLAEMDVGLGRVGVSPGRRCSNWRRASKSCPTSASRASRSIPARSRISKRRGCAPSRTWRSCCARFWPIFAPPAWRLRSLAAAPRPPFSTRTSWMASPKSAPARMYLTTSTPCAAADARSKTARRRFWLRWFPPPGPAR